jgi:hypothetical protein
MGFMALCIVAFSAISVGGALVFRRWFERWLGLTEAHNAVIESFLSVSGLFYGITLGLIAVGTYDTFKAANETLTEEASTINALYRDIGMLAEREPRAAMQDTVRAYTEYLVGEGWKLQQQGIVPKKTSAIVSKLEEQLSDYKLQDDKDGVVFAQVLAQDNQLSELRRKRVAYVTAGLPGSVWDVLIIGAAIVTILTWMLVIDNKKLDIMINLLCGALLGTLIFIIAAMDYPFRGEFSVKPTPYQLLLDGVMKREP